VNSAPDDFERLLAADRKVERRLFWRELVVLAAMIAIVVWRLRVGT
jgi:hypothetical protein